MAAALVLLGRAAALLTGAQRLLRVGGSAERCLCRGIGSDAPPKRPLTAYFRFVKEQHSAFRQKNPEMNNWELVKKIAGAWKELPASQKQIYEEAKKTDWQNYKEQLAAYKAQLSPARAVALRQEREKKMARKRLLRARKELTVLGKPKRPRNSFNMFVSENFQESDGITAVAKLKKLFDTWQRLSSSQKQPYMQLAEDDRVRYKNEMKVWEAKMVELGREDLVRSKKRSRKTSETAKTAEKLKASSHEKKKNLKLKESEE